MQDKLSYIFFYDMENSLKEIQEFIKKDEMKNFIFSENFYFFFFFIRKVKIKKEDKIRSQNI